MIWYDMWYEEDMRICAIVCGLAGDISYNVMIGWYDMIYDTMKIRENV